MQQIQATDQAFAAILADGSVVTWGDAEYGGDSSEVQDQLRGVQQIQAAREGRICCHSGRWIGSLPGVMQMLAVNSSAVREQLKGVQQIEAANGAFAAILADGFVVTWGDADFGGDSSAVQHELRFV